MRIDLALNVKLPPQNYDFEGLCCTNQLMAGVPLSLDGLIPRPP